MSSSQSNDPGLLIDIYNVKQPFTYVIPGKSTCALLRRCERDTESVQQVQPSLLAEIRIFVHNAANLLEESCGRIVVARKCKCNGQVQAHPQPAAVMPVATTSQAILISIRDKIRPCLVPSCEEAGAA